MNIRLKRLESEFNEVSSMFESSSFIHIESTRGNPPERYTIKYDLQGLDINSDGEIFVVNSFRIEISLPLDYPRSPPRCAPLTPIFHPNFDQNTICIGDFWAASETISDLIIRIGMMISYQSFNIQSPLNGQAARWADENRDKLPIDPIDLFPNTVETITTPEPTSIKEQKCNNCGSTNNVGKCSSGHTVCSDCSVATCKNCGSDVCVLCEDFEVCVNCQEIFSVILSQFEKIKEQSWVKANSYLESQKKLNANLIPVEQLHSEFRQEISNTKKTVGGIKTLYEEDNFISAYAIIDNLSSAFDFEDIDSLRENLQKKYQEIDDLFNYSIEFEKTDLNKSLIYLNKVNKITKDHNDAKHKINILESTIAKTQKKILDSAEELSRNNFFKVDKIISTIPDSFKSDELAHIRDVVDAAIKSANECFEHSLNQDNKDRLLKIYRDTKCISNDYPSIDDLIKGTQFFLKRLERQYQQTIAQIDNNEFGKVYNSLAAILEDFHHEEKVAEIQDLLQRNEKAAAKRKKKKQVLLFLFSSICISLIAFYSLGNYSENRFKEATHLYTEIDKAITLHQFNLASEKLTKAESLLTKSYTVSEDKKKALLEKIQKISRSEVFQNGLKGLVNWHGHYVPLTQYSDLIKYDKLKQAAIDSNISMDPLAASKLFTDAKNYCEKFEICRTNEISDLENQLDHVELEIFGTIIIDGNDFLSKDKLDQADHNFQKALEFYTDNNLNRPDKLKYLESRIEELNKRQYETKLARFKELLAEADDQFNNDEFLNNIDSNLTMVLARYKGIEAYYSENDLIAPELMKKIDNLISKITKQTSKNVKKKFSILLTEADKLFKEKSYKRSLHKYNECLLFYKNNELSDKKSLLKIMRNAEFCNLYEKTRLQDFDFTHNYSNLARIYFLSITDSSNSENLSRKQRLHYNYPQLNQIVKDCVKDISQKNLETAKKLIESRRFEKAIPLLKRTLLIISNNKLKNNEELSSVYRLLVEKLTFAKQAKYPKDSNGNIVITVNYEKDDIRKVILDIQDAMTYEYSVHQTVDCKVTVKGTGPPIKLLNKSLSYCNLKLVESGKGYIIINK